MTWAVARAAMVWLLLSSCLRGVSLLTMVAAYLVVSIVADLTIDALIARAERRRRR